MERGENSVMTAQLSQHSPYERNGTKPFWLVGKGKVTPLDNL